MKIYHNPRCGTSRKTLALLEEKNASFEVIEYLKDLPTKKELKKLIDMIGISPGEFVRKNETIYKEQFKGKELTDDEWLDAMMEYPKLIQRPIVVKGKKAILGRPPENVLELI